MSEYTYIAHHGIKGQKWGVRRFQNKDGSLTALGRSAKRAAYNAKDTAKKAAKGAVTLARKKFAPTSADLDEQIAKERAKLEIKDKKEELKKLKSGVDPKKQKVGATKFSEMTDKDIQDRINRLNNEATLRNLEITKNMGPGKKLVYDALKEGGKQAIKNIVANSLTKEGEKAMSEMLAQMRDSKGYQLDKELETARKKSSLASNLANEQQKMQEYRDYLSGKKPENSGQNKKKKK